MNAQEYKKWIHGADFGNQLLIDAYFQVLSFLAFGPVSVISVVPTEVTIYPKNDSTRFFSIASNTFETISARLIAAGYRVDTTTIDESYGSVGDSWVIYIP